MKTIKLNHVELNIFAENLINSLTIDHLKKVLPQIEPFLNKKILLASGTKAKTFTIELLDYDDKPNQIRMRTFLSFNHMFGYSNLELKQSLIIPNKELNGGGYSVRYFDKDITLGVVKNGVLDELFTIDHITERNNLLEKYDYTEIKKLIAEQDELEEKARVIARKVNRFKTFN